MQTFHLEPWERLNKLSISCFYAHHQGQKRPSLTKNPKPYPEVQIKYVLEARKRGYS